MYEYNDIKYLKSRLNTDLENGLTDIEAKARLEKNGYNTIEGKKKKSVFNIFFKQLKDPMIYILLCAIIISFLLKEYNDSFVILFVVILNAFIGTIQEVKTEKSLEMLNKLSSKKSVVIRGGKKHLLDSKEIVTGDLLVLESGDSIGADVRIIESHNLKIDESSITGESHPVNKDAGVLENSIKNVGDKTNLAYMSSLVVEGKGKGIVINTAMNTEIGKIAKLLKEEKDELTPLQKKLGELGKVLGVITIIICGLLFVLAIIDKRDILEMFITSISLAVAAIPEGLPAVVTIVLALGMQRMAKVNAMVKRLPCVETLGSVNVVCSDKTGTITENKLKCVGVYEGVSYLSGANIKDEDFLLCANLCNNAYLDNKECIGSPIECELKRMTLNKKIDVEAYQRKEEIEFNSSRKMMSTLNNVNGKNNQYTKGAFDKIISKCKYIKIEGRVSFFDEKTKKKISEKVDELSYQGMRILAFSYKEDVLTIQEENMIFLGFLAFFDPPRVGVRESVERFKEAGIKTIMITGDYKNTAFSIAKDVGIAKEYNECISGEEFDLLDNEGVRKIVKEKTVFARVTPTHKSMIVEALKNSGDIVAMTGDGVNDAPSLKMADIGISMGVNGSEVSKEASDMILLDDNFSTIEKAVEQGRVIYDNIKKTILFLLSSNFAEIIVMIVSIFLKLPLPLLATHILIINLLTDSIPALALGVDKKESDVMKRTPRGKNEGIFSNSGIIKTLLYGTLIGVLTLVAFFLPSISMIRELGMKINLNNIQRLLTTQPEILAKSQTLAFMALGCLELFYSVVSKNLSKSIYDKSRIKNKYLNLAIIIGVLMVAICIYSPLSKSLGMFKLTTNEFAIMILFSTAIVFVHEFIYFWFHMKQKINKKAIKKII